MKLRTAILSGIAALVVAAIAANAQVPGVNSTLNSVFTLAYDNSTMKPTYASSSQITIATAPSDICTLTGSATKNVRIRRIFLAGEATNADNVRIAVAKRSTANSGGTATTPEVVPYDSGSSAGTAVMRAYTANPTEGTTIGHVTETMIPFGNLTTGLGAPQVIYYGELGSPIVLRGTSEVAAVNLGNQTVSGGVANCVFEWTEE